MPYLTVDQYVERYGSAETTRLTDETRSGVIDTTKVELAIGDATDMAEAYIGKRYKVPIPNPPRLVVGMVAILARELLWKNKPNSEVTREADIVRKQLKDISSGAMTIPGADGVLPEDGLAPADSASSNDRTCPIFTEAAMFGYGVPNGYALANWRKGC